jgi:hypothetical protein
MSDPSCRHVPCAWPAWTTPTLPRWCVTPLLYLFLGQAREPDADATEQAEATRLQKELSTIVNEFILKRGNILNARHLPPKVTPLPPSPRSSRHL